MKTSKRLWALLLTFCMVLAMIPAVSAAKDEETGTFTYDFDVVKIANANGITITGNQSLASADDVLTRLKTAGHIDWKFKSTTLSTSATYTLFSLNGYFYGRASGYQYVAFEIDNPGKGIYELSVNHAVSSNGAGGIGVYILPGDTADITSALKTDTCVGSYTCYSESETAKDYNTTNVGHNSKLESTWEVKDDNSYIVVFRLEKYPSGQSKIYLSQLVLTPVAAEKEDEAEIVGGTTYDSVEEAIGAATSGQEVKLLTDADASSAVELGTGVTLNLNGKKLTAPSVNATAPNAKVKDGSNGQGLLAVSQNTENATYLNVQNNNGQLPLYDAAEGAEGYRFFDFTLQSIDDVEKDANTRRFWFKLTLNEKAYELIATGNSGLIVKTGWTWKGEAINGVDNFVFQAATVTGWASAMAEADNYGFYLDVTGFDSVNEDGILAVTPKIESAGIEISAASAIEYAHNAA